MRRASVGELKRSPKSRFSNHEVPMPKANDLLEKARMFDQRAEQANDPISREYWREMAIQYRCLSIDQRIDPAVEFAQ
jgi:hypothetical protein